MKPVIDLLFPQLRLSHDPIDRFFEQAAVEAAHMHHMEALLLQHMSHFTGRLDLLKVRLQIEFEQSLDDRPLQGAGLRTRAKPSVCELLADRADKLTTLDLNSTLRVRLPLID